MQRKIMSKLSIMAYNWVVINMFANAKILAIVVTGFQLILAYRM